jgi:hypothetical protein
VDWSKVQTVPSQVLSYVPLAEPHAGWLLWDHAGSGRIYAVDDDRLLRHIPSLQAFEHRFAWRNLLPLPAEQISRFRLGPPMGQ